MGYYMTQMDQDFTIFAANKQAAFDLLKQWEQKVIAKYLYPNDEYNRPLRNAKTLEDALAELDWETENDESGNITELCFTGDKLHDEDEWLDAIAPMVEKRSKLIMCGENGHYWCWYFDGESCVDYPGEIVFPDMPEE